jgi:hypothetical protein
MSSQNENKVASKPGRTLLVKPNTDNFDESVFTKMDGLSEEPHKSGKTNSWFLTFKTFESSEAAYKVLSEMDNLRVKYALYKVYCKFENLSDNNDYNDVKHTHTNLIESEHEGKVLYYKLYRKNDKYLGCGELTVDTKKTFDYLLNTDDGMKKVSLGNDLLVTHFRFQRRQKTNFMSNNN